MLHLCKKLYWTRSWIVQEVLMAQKVLLVYEDQALPSAAVCMLFERYDKDGQWPYQENLPMYYGTDSGSLVTILGSTAASVWRHQLKRSGSLSELHLADLLRDYRSLQCETLHDKVCVLRSLVDENFSTPITPYLRTSFTVVSLPSYHGPNKSELGSWRDFAADCSLVVY